MNAQVLGSDITVGSGAATVATVTKLAIDKRSGTPFLLLLAPNAGYLRLWTSNQNPGVEDISDYGVMRMSIANGSPKVYACIWVIRAWIDVQNKF